MYIRARAVSSYSPVDYEYMQKHIQCSKVAAIDKKLLISVMLLTFHYIDNTLFI